jgi:site-specific DNA recombinase
MIIDDKYSSTYLIYNRKSTDDAENQKNSLAYQRLRNIEFAQREHLPIASSLSIAGFCENGIIDESHSAFKEGEDFEIGEDGTVKYQVLRPKFIGVASLMHNKAIKGVVILCWDRLSRNKHDDLLIQKLIKEGADIRFTETQYQKGSAGDLHMGIAGMFSAHYSSNISEKVKNAQKKLHDEGRCTYATPIGYLDCGSDNKPLDPIRAPLVKRIFELYATGEWSHMQLSKWAQEQGLTKKPARKKRTKIERLNNVELASIPKIARPVDHKTIEYILSNPFYIGQIKVDNKYQKSNAHQALIDTATFNKVQSVLSSRTKSVHYVDKPFFAYRALLNCSCGRSYSPYPQKGHVYYRSRCKNSCENVDPNLSEADIDKAVQKLLDSIYLNDEELNEIEVKAKIELGKLNQNRDKKLDDLQNRQRNFLADIDYLTTNKITLLRTGSMSIEYVAAELENLETNLATIQTEIKIYTESASDMLKFVISFSQLIKNAGLYFQFALDSEKREIVSSIFTELTFDDKKIVKYKAKEGFDWLLTRNRVSGSAGRDRTYDQLVNSEPLYR